MHFDYPLDCRLVFGGSGWMVDGGMGKNDKEEDGMRDL
jgi:hypothetical protein